MVLWKRESCSVDASFVDLFERFESPYLAASFKNWDRKLEAAKWNKKFMLHEIVPGKSNETSDYLREAGNRKFREKDFIEAMELYSQSLCFAEPETNNVSLAYANRATCFLRMEKFDKCLRDIDLAVEANYPFMQKLMKRKDECKQAMEKAGPKTDAIEIKLDFERNEKYPCMADVLDVQKNTEYGRHIIAKCDIGVGLTVLIEKSFISNGNAIDRVQCYGCLKEERNFIACPKCTDVMFCSKECQNNIIHEKICGENLNRMPSEVRYLAESILAGLVAFSSADDMMQFVNDILQKRTEVPPATNDQRSKYGLFLSLQPSKRITLDIDPNARNMEWLGMAVSNIELIYKVFTALLEIPLVSVMFITLKSKRFLMHLIAEHSFILANNSFKLSVPGGVIGRELGLVSSLFNHACAPNVFNATNIGGDTDIFISIRPIKKGDQVFIGYGYPLEEVTEVRRAELKQKYNFDCKCDKCEPHSSDSDRSLMASNPNFQCVRAARFGINSKNLPNLKYNCIAFLNECGHLPWSKEMGIVLDTFTNILFDELKIEY